MIIDAHTHGIHEKYMDRLQEAGGAWATRYLAFLKKTAVDRPACINVAARVRQLDRHGIDFQVVTPYNNLDVNKFDADSATQLKFAMTMNDSMAKLRDDSQGRLIPAGTVPLEDFEKGGRKEMERAIGRLGLKAMTVVSNIKGKSLDLPEFEGFWRLANDLHAVILIHPNNPSGNSDRKYEAEFDLMHTFGWPMETMLAISRLVFSGIMDRCPDLNIVTHHLGGGIPFLWGRISETYSTENTPETLGRHTDRRSFMQSLSKPLFHYFSRFYYDTAVGGLGDSIKLTCNVFGADQVIFATDAPWGPRSGEDRLAGYQQTVKSAGLSEVDTEKILSGNARRIFGLG